MEVEVRTTLWCCLLSHAQHRVSDSAYKHKSAVRLIPVSTLLLSDRESLVSAHKRHSVIITIYIFRCFMLLQYEVAKQRLCEHT